MYLLMCCENPIELECINSCDNLIIPLVVTSDYTIKTEFNGSGFNVLFTVNSSGYAVLSKTNLNEDYTYTFGVYNGSGVLAGCYKIKIYPAALCCESGGATDAAEVVLMDVATLNADTFLTAYVAQGRSYGYECVACKYNGNAVGLGVKMMFTTADPESVPVQIAPRDTIPEHTLVSQQVRITHGRNWITFLQSLPIASYLTFRASPFGGYNFTNPLISDRGWPESIVSIVSDPILDIVTYGEGFQIEYPKGTTFSFKINFIYSNGTQVVGHNVVYKDDAYYINGAKVWPANMRVITNV